MSPFAGDNNLHFSEGRYKVFSLLLRSERGKLWRSV